MRLRRASAFVVTLIVLSAAAEPGTPSSVRSPSEPKSRAPLRSGPTIAGCPVFPADNIWNVRVDRLPVLERSNDYVASIGAEATLKPDFGAGLYEGVPMGVPFEVVPPDQALVAIHHVPFGDESEAYGHESDPGPYPIPRRARVEGGPDSRDDRHVIVVQSDACVLYELYKAVPNDDGSWNAMASARWDLRSHHLRPEGWTSADAAGLPILPGLVRYEEVAAGEIRHALRFTAPRTRKAYLWPARHFASDTEDPTLPAMGERFRLKASVDISRFSPANQVILRALQTYGMILSDNGSPWFVTGTPDDGWNNDELNDELRQIKGSDFEAVDASSLMIDPNSAQARAP
jgi:hypothetical protein